MSHSSNHSTLGSVPSEPLVYAPKALKCNSLSDLGQTTSAFESKQIPAQLANSILSSEAEYTRVGFSGLRISNPVLGTLGIGDKRWMKWVMEEEEVRSRAFGINGSP